VTLKPRLGSRRGFTLVEVLVVLVILGLLTGLLLAGVGSARVAVNKAKCLSNQRQIGLALMNYAHDHDGMFPPTTHSTGSWKKERSWIYELAPYLADMDEIRICPAEPAARQKQIRDRNATSYVLNDLVFDSYEHNSLLKVPKPSQTILLFTLSESRAPSITRDHIHGGEWSSWARALNDIEPDRHRFGARASNRLKGSANYLYADGRVENKSASELKSLFDRGINPAAVPAE
jgi:prepilin-type N-terminal cleavage/methylation domain-containing protein/prepilin-type processing-associated H-X9-DG protein